MNPGHVLWHCLDARGFGGLRQASQDAALCRLAHADAHGTERLLRACAACIAADGLVSEAQGELMRAIADSLGAPMPPLLPGQKLL